MKPIKSNTIKTIIIITLTNLMICNIFDPNSKYSLDMISTYENYNIKLKNNNFETFRFSDNQNNSKSFLKSITNDIDTGVKSLNSTSNQVMIEKINKFNIAEEMIALKDDYIINKSKHLYDKIIEFSNNYVKHFNYTNTEISKGSIGDFIMKESFNSENLFKNRNMTMEELIGHIRNKDI